MAFLRNKNRERFTTIDNEAVRDDSLSLKALGLLVKLLSLPDNWQFSENGLDEIFKKDGQSSIRSGLKELEKYGYLNRYKVRDGKGRIVKIEWEIFETPRVDYPHLENPNMDNPNLENQPQYNTNTSTTKESNKKESNTYSRTTTKRFSPPTVEEVQAYCTERNNSVDPEKFVAYYTSNGWMVGKNHMKNWKSAIITWEKNDKKGNANGDNGKSGGYHEETESYGIIL